MGTTEETLRTEREARRASAERCVPGRHSDAIAQYLAAYEYAERKLEEDEERAREHRE